VDQKKLQAYEPKIRRTNDVLEINLELDTNHVSFVSLARSKVLRVNKAIITLPPTEELTISAVSGDLNLSAPQCQDKLTINSVSGDVNLSNVECQEIDIRTTSGDLRLNDVNAKTQIKVSSVSGDLLAQSISFKEMRMDTVSGDAVIRELSDHLSFHPVQVRLGRHCSTYGSTTPSRIEFSTLSAQLKWGNAY